MRHCQHTNYPGKIAKWLLAVAMLFNLSTYTGYAGCFQRPATAPVKTELVVATYQNIAKPVSYQYPQAKFYKSKVISCFYKNNFRLVSLISLQLFKAAFSTCLKQAFCIRQAKNFDTQKTIPQNSQEEFPHPFRG